MKKILVSMLLVFAVLMGGCSTSNKDYIKGYYKDTFNVRMGKGNAKSLCKKYFYTKDNAELDKCAETYDKYLEEFKKDAPTITYKIIEITEEEIPEIKAEEKAEMVKAGFPEGFEIAAVLKVKLDSTIKPVSGDEIKEEGEVETHTIYKKGSKRFMSVYALMVGSSVPQE